ncbi:hypothetical protein SRHO_G00014730 [Serrasalmus rhombeus]
MQLRFLARGKGAKSPLNPRCASIHVTEELLSASPDGRQAGMGAHRHRIRAALLPATDASCLTWEGEGFQGKNAIMGKLSSLPFQTIQHSITAQDHHPTPDSCVMSMVMGQLKADQDQVMGFQQVFLLKNVDNKWVCTNDMFRLALHNFGA